MFGKFDKKTEKMKSRVLQFLEIITMFWIIGIIIYIVRNIVELIPSPLDGVYGFKHILVSELRNATVFSFVFLMFQNHLTDRIRYYYTVFF